MKCPYCQTEMENGFLTDLGFDGYAPQWRAKHEEPSFFGSRPGRRIQFKSKNTVSKLHRLFEIQADYCRRCEKFIFDGKAMEE